VNKAGTVQRKIQTPAEELIKVLEDEIEAVLKVIDYLFEQQDALVIFSGDSLEYASERCNQASRKVRLLEKERIKLLEKYIKGTPAESLGATPEGFEKWIASLDNRSGLKLKLIELRDKLRVTIIDLVQLNLVNKMLMEHSMNFTQNKMQMVTSNYKRQIVDHKI
jgi:flagellar biosynthesis/type III secretory pathway chaperone